MVRPKVDMIGRTFGRLTVVEQTEGKQKDRQAWYLCRCQCGKRIKARGTSLRRGQTASCGCLRVDMTRRRNKNVFIIWLFRNGLRRADMGVVFGDVYVIAGIIIMLRLII